MVGKVSGKLSKWTWSCHICHTRGETWCANNLIASMMWHKFMALKPKSSLVVNVQRRLVDFFWSGEHWTRALVLHLPKEEGEGGLINIQSRIKTFRIQTAQRLLYKDNVMWTGTVCALERCGGDLRHNKCLFLIKLGEMDLPQYQLVLRAWSSVCKAKKDITIKLNINKEPFFF